MIGDISIMTHQNYLENSPVKKNYITLGEYEEFKKQYLIDVFKGLRYGQSFCNYFNIPNGTPLYYFRDHNTCEDWIIDNYLEKK